MFNKLLLAAALLLAPSLARADWHEATSEHFVVYSDDTPARVQQYAERLERFDRALRYITGTPDKRRSPLSRVTVYMVEDVATIQKLAGSTFVAGFFQSRASGPVAFAPRRTSGPLDAQTILLHEYGHNFMFSNWPDVVFAPWFVEGFAEFVGTAIFRGNGDLVLGKNPDHRSWSIDKSNHMPAELLVKLDQGKLDEYQRSALYARGWLLTHYLLMDKERSKQLADYIVAVNSGKSIDEATRALGNISQLDGRLNGYFKRPALPSIVLTSKDVLPGTVTIRRVSAAEAAIMPARILSSNGVSEKTAPGVAALARRLAAPFPNDAAAQNELAEAEFDAGNYAAAEAAADRAMATDPKSIHALLYKGMAQAEAAKKAGVTDDTRWKAIRGWFIRANKLDTEYPEPLIQYYESFGAAKQKPSKAAVGGLLYAYALAPYDLGLRLKAGRVLLTEGETKAARVAFEPIAYGPHYGNLSTQARAIIDALDSGGTPPALKVIEEAESKAKAEADKAKKQG
jgi:tetratricopeptide (TPR) repeat protein